MGQITAQPRRNSRRPLPNLSEQTAIGLWTTSRWTIAVLGLVLIVFSARVGTVALTDSMTSDESTHLVHGLHFWATGDDLNMWALGTPRLPHLVNSFPSFVVLAATGKLAEMRVDPRGLVLSGDRNVLVPARLCGWLWGIGLIATTAWGTVRLWGPTLATLAAGLVSMVPEIIAHSALAGSDVPFATLAMLAVVLLARHAERPAIDRWLAASAAIGAAWATRHTGILLMGLAGVVALVVALRHARPWSMRALALRLGKCLALVAALSLIAGTVLWMGDGLETVTPSELTSQVHHASVPQRIGPVDIAHWPIPTSLVSLAVQVRHQGTGHQAHFLGERGEHGWPRYFPVAFGLKTPIGLLGLLVLALALVRPRSTWEWTCLGLLGLLWISLVRSHVNIGVRYALLTYPLAAPFLVQLFHPDRLRDRVWGPLTLVCALLFLGESIAAHPRYLSWFNAIGGGPARGWLYLADSNTDWGQDLDRVAEVCQRLGITEVTTDINSDRALVAPGLPVYRFASQEDQRLDDPTTPVARRIPEKSGHYLSAPTRHMAVSTSRLMGLYGQNDLDWLRSRRLVERVGDSVFLFDLARPAERPFGP